MPSRDIKSALRQRIAKFEADFQNALKEELEIPAKKVTAKHRRVVSSWKNKPIFSYRITVNGKQVRLTVFPKGAGRQQYMWVNDGTEPYIIRPKNGKFLRFQTGYSPKSSAETSSFTVGGGQRSGAWVSAKQVNHPGIKARKFSDKFAKEVLPEMRAIIENAFRRASASKL